MGEIMKLVMNMMAQQQTFISNLIKDLPNMIAQAVAQHLSQQQQPSASITTGTITISPAPNTAGVKSAIQARRASQPDLRQVFTAQAKPTPTTSVTPTTSTSTSSPTPDATLVATPISKSSTAPRRSPSHISVQNTHRDQYLPLDVMEERIITSEDGEEKKQFLIKWKTSGANNTSWEDADDSVVVNSGLNLKWAKHGRKRQQQQQQDKENTNPNITSNANPFQALAEHDEKEEETPVEKKYNHETPGQPGTSDDDDDSSRRKKKQQEISTPQMSNATPTSHKRSRAATTTLPPQSATSPREEPSSSRDLFKKPKRASAMEATAQITALLEKEEREVNDLDMTYKKQNE
jgi:hypothetical protein